MRASALACTCTSALLGAVAWAGDVPPNAARVAMLELEAGLAKKPAIYLVLRAPEHVLEVKARGVVLDTITLTGIEMVSPRPLLHAARPEALTVPVLLTIASGQGDSVREVIAPETLRPAPRDDEEEEEAEPTGTRPPAPPATPTPIPEPPADFRAQLDNGWDLWICEALPPQGVLARFRAAVRDGWHRLWGATPALPPALTLAMARDDAKRLFHLVGSGRVILVAAGS